MPTVQIVPGTAVLAGAAPGAQMDVQAQGAPGRATAGLGAEIAAQSDVIGQFAIRKQNAINAADVLDGQLKMEQARGDFQNELSTNQDPDTWKGLWAQKAQDVRSQVLGNDKLAPVVKEHLTRAVDEFAVTEGVKVGIQANARTIQIQKAKMQVFADTFWKAGDFDKGAMAIDAMRDHGLIDDVQHRQMLDQGKTVVSIAQVNRQINDDPITATEKLEAKGKDGEWLNYDGLDENQRESLKVEARRATSSVRADTVNELEQRRLVGEIIPGLELQKLVDQKKLLPTQMKWILQEQARQGSDAGQITAFAKHLTEIDQYDKTNDPTNEHYAQLTADRLKFPADLRAEAKSRLDAKLTPSSTNIVTKQANAYIDTLTGKGVLGPSQKGDGTREEIEKTYTMNVQLKRELETWIKANPGKSSVDQVAFINQWLERPRNVAASLPLFNALSGRAQPTAGLPSVTTPEAYARLPAGARYLDSTGKPATKGK